MGSTEDPERTKKLRINTEDFPGTTFWNGLPTAAMKGTAVVADTDQFPKYWAREEGIIGQRIPVVRVVLDGVNAGGGTIYLDNRDGSGWFKVTDGRGSPRWPHSNVTIEKHSFRFEHDPRQYLDYTAHIAVPDGPVPVVAYVDGQRVQIGVGTIDQANGGIFVAEIDTSNPHAKAIWDELSGPPHYSIGVKLSEVECIRKGKYR